MSSDASAGRLPCLDGWRALAIVLVLGDHFPYTTGFPASLQPVWGQVFDGNLGVRLFFVLSGFLITHLLFGEFRRFGAIDLRKFYIRRALRIFPLYFAYLAMLAVLTLAGLYADTLSSWIGATTFTRNVVGRGNSATIHFWSLAVEEQFYLLWPGAIVAAGLFVRRRRAAAFLLALVLVALATRGLAVVTPSIDFNLVLGERSILRYADSLAIGCLAAVLLSPLARTIGGRTAAAALAIVILGLVLRTHDIPAAMRVAIPTLQAVAIALLLVYSVGLRSGPVHGLLNAKWVVRLGVLSYSLYVWHVLFVAHFFRAFRDAPLYDWKWWLVPSFAIAYASHRFIERPFLTLKERFAPEDRSALARAGH